MPVSGKKRRVSILLLAWMTALYTVLVPAAESQDALKLGFGFFNDNRKVNVLAGLLSYRHALGPATEVSLGYKVDSISSASVSCSTCHRGNQNIARNEVNLGISRQVGRTALSLDYYNSREKDYASDGITLAAEGKFRQDNTTLSLSYNHGWDRPRPHGWRLWRRNRGRGSIHNDFNFAAQVPPDQVDDARTNTLALTWTQVLSRRTIAQVNWELSAFDGYQSDPYHLVTSNNEVDRLENHPRSRRRFAVAGRLRQALSYSTTLGADYRFYIDDWGVDSHTASLELGRYLAGKDLLLELRYRHYIQSAADFYQTQYDGSETFISSDDRLQGFSTMLFGVELSRVNLGGLTRVEFFKPLYLSLAYERYIGGSALVGSTSSGRLIRGSAADLRSNILRMELEVFR